MERAVADVQRVLERTLEGDQDAVAPIVRRHRRRGVRVVLERVAGEVERDVG